MQYLCLCEHYQWRVCPSFNSMIFTPFHHHFYVRSWIWSNVRVKGCGSVPWYASIAAWLGSDCRFYGVLLRHRLAHRPRIRPWRRDGWSRMPGNRGKCTLWRRQPARGITVVHWKRACSLCKCLAFTGYASKFCHTVYFCSILDLPARLHFKNYLLMHFKYGTEKNEFARKKIREFFYLPLWCVSVL